MLIVFVMMQVSLKQYPLAVFAVLASVMPGSGCLCHVLAHHRLHRQDTIHGHRATLIMPMFFVSNAIYPIPYESFVHPLTILSGLPSAGLGAQLPLLAFRVDSLYAFVGVINADRLRARTAAASLKPAHEAIGSSFRPSSGLTSSSM